MTSTAILDLTREAVGFRVRLPAPEEPPPVPRGKTPTLFWPVRTAKGDRLGYLRLRSNRVRLLVSIEGGSSSFSWHPLNFLPGFDLVRLQARPDSAVVILDADDAVPDDQDDAVYVRAAILCDDPCVENCGMPHSEVQVGGDTVVDIRPIDSGRVLQANSILTLQSPAIQAAEVFDGRAWEAAAPAKAPDMLFVPLAEVSVRSVNWIVRGVAAEGKIMVIAGEPGLGKSMLMADIAAAVSSGRPWGPDLVETLIGDVMLVSPEDDASNSLKPRILAAGGRDEQIHVIRDKLAAIDIAAIIKATDERPNVKMLIIDPISGCLGGHDMNSTVAMRKLLMPLAAWADERSIGVILVTHLNKARGRAPLARVIGSHAIVAVSRLAFIVCHDPGSDHQQLMLPLKDNLGLPRRGFRYQIEGVTLPNGIGSARIVFDTRIVEMSAVEALTAPDLKFATSAVDEAEAFLRELLTLGEQTAGDVKAAAEAHGISMASLRRARMTLAVKPRKGGMTSGWKWALPSVTSDDAARQVDHNKSLDEQAGEGAHESNEYLREDEHLRLEHPEELDDE